MTIVVHKMLHAHVVSAPEAFTVIVTHVPVDVRMAVFFVIVRVRAAMMFDVPASGFDAVVKTPSLHVSVFGRRLVPPPVLLHVTSVLECSGIRL
jgi:hypothetical protein